MRIFFTLFVALCFHFIPFCNGQQVSQMPEMNEMFQNGIKYELSGKYDEAITVYRQFLNMEPGNDLVSYQLGTMYYRTQQFKAAIEILEPLFFKKMRKEEVYTLLSASQVANKEVRSALITIKRGIDLFPSNGLMYYQEGNVYQAASNFQDAFFAYCTGINTAPTFIPNYKEASNSAFAATAQQNSHDLLWGLLYGETYILLKKDTIGHHQLKMELYRNWKAYYDGLGDRIAKNELTDFEKKVWDTKLATTPLMSSGFTLENFVKCQHSFQEKWNLNGDKRYPFYLFTFYDQLREAGLLDTYTIWFWQGVIPGTTSTLTNEETDNLKQWLASHPLQVTTHGKYVTH